MDELSLVLYVLAIALVVLSWGDKRDPPPPPGE